MCVSSRWMSPSHTSTSRARVPTPTFIEPPYATMQSIITRSWINVQPPTKAFVHVYEYTRINYLRFKFSTRVFFEKKRILDNPLFLGSRKFSKSSSFPSTTTDHHCEKSHQGKKPISVIISSSIRNFYNYTTQNL